MFFGFEGITVRYGKHTVLRDVTLSLRRGEQLTLIGQNGCGKSTLLRTVFRAVPVAAGQVVWEDRPLAAYTAAARARQIAYLPQDPPPLADIDVETLVGYGRYPHTAPLRGMTAADRAAVEQALLATETAHLRRRRFATLSGGEAQRVRLAMCLAQEPRVLILDEPTAHLDAGQQLRLLELLRRLRAERELTVLAVLHDLNHAARYSDRICALHDGGIFACGTPAQVLTAPRLATLFGIRAELGWDEEYRCPTVLEKPMEGDPT